MSSAPTIRAGGGSGKAKPKRKPNAIRRIMDHEQRVREKSVASSSPINSPAAATAPARSVCKNPQCDKSDVRDGACQNCGRVVWESNIVAEVTFGESANGAAVVHGSYLAADQGGIRPTAGGLAFRRVAGAGASEARERSLREAKQLMNQFGHQLQIAPVIAEKAFQVYKFASNSNFIQGRRKNTVAAVCVYAVCRKEDNNRVMLIDLADIIKTDVFLLGRSYKDLLTALPDMKDGTKPIIIEDLIYRFATKLEFLHDTNKVALSAIRIAQRMRHDNITHGRRPAGICGAALIMAARAHNFRRTVREVVYIAKVTMTTLQELPSVPIDPALETGGASAETSAPPASLTPQTADTPAPGVDKDGFAVPYRKPTQEDLSIANAATAEVDGQLEDLADEFGDSEEDEPEELDPNSEMAMAAAQGIQVPGMENMRIKPREPVPAPENDNQANPNGDEASSQKPEKPTLRIDEEWELDENNLEQEMQGHLNDPAMIGASALVTRDIEQRREQIATVPANPTPAPAPPKANTDDASAENSTEPATQPVTNGTTPGPTQSNVSDDPIIHEDEFKDDPEVMFCKLSERDVLLKEMIWANHNKDYMRKVQQKIFEAKVLQNNPPKPKRSRARKPRIGEGQASPAGSATEAAQNMLRARAISTKLDYSRMGNLFEFSKTGPGSTYGGASSVGSRSALPSSAGSDAGSDEEDANGAQTPTPAAAAAMTPQERAAKALAPPEEEEEEEEEDGNEFGGEEGFQGEEDAYEEEDFDPFGDNNGGDDFEE
ncbi:Brf1-like TBP-binding domain-containing protein [Chaetomium fimeti]|uniref:Brf1-like TBP-binding domain-containing protein n=1 Tax=Chaetomium fimeti TaxID=1854472 RepID=A0AAE0LRC2_9PEZI|nr:Brf1-like TBP-binding domain-containing protein [Chaetomium fimeti]